MRHLNHMLLNYDKMTVGLLINLFVVVACFSFKANGFGQHTTIPPDSWTGRWLPERTTKKPINNELTELFHPGHSQPMGVLNSCDDGKTNLKVDYDDNPEAKICFHPRQRYIPDYSLPSILDYENIPKSYSAQHRCMNESISYSSQVPTFGPHRQLWAVYGEYEYLPPQRWVHNLEHGAIVALYHPCADKFHVKQLKKHVKSCLWRHIITPSPNLSDKMPFALVAWGVRLSMSVADAQEIRAFVQAHALKGPEHVEKDGQFAIGLIKRADKQDESTLCPLPYAHD